MTRLLAPLLASSLASSLALSLASCGSTMGRGGPMLSGSNDEEGATRETNPDRALVARLNAAARAGAVTERIHGVEVSDPYRMLETESPGTTAWIEGQTERSRRMLEGWMDPRATDRLQTLLSIGAVMSPAVAGENIFYQKREGDREQPLLMVEAHGRMMEAPLIDPLSYGERSALDWYAPSPRGTYVAFGISENGDERSTLRVVEVATGRVLDETIPRTKWCDISWLHSERGFYYTRYPKPDEDGFDAENEDAYFPRVFFHALGTDPSADPLVFGASARRDFPSASVSDDDRWVVINVGRGWSECDVHLFDRGRAPRSRVAAPDDAHPVVPVVVGRHDLTVGHVHAGKLWLFTNVGAPRYRIAVTDLDRASDVDAWRDVVPERDAPIEGWAFARDRLVLHYIEDVQSRIRTFRLDGTAAGDINLPSAGSIDGLAASPDESTVAFAFSSYAHPPTLYAYDLSHDRMREVDAVVSDLDFSQFVVTRERVRSRDGTEIPVTLVQPRNAPRDGQQPVILYGYGGFNVSILPSFSRNVLYWIERGGTYAFANLRGGGEFGEQWHRAGNLANKERVFEDFEGVIRWLASSGISRPERIAITGGSNGGLLMGAMITRCPSAFAAAATYVGLYDMLRYDRFPPAELWVSEYGTANDPEQFRWLLAYSPYHHVTDGTHYPAVLVETADHDSRVHWGHSTKFAARLEDAQAGDAPILFYVERSVGHGAGTRLSDLVTRYARQYAFIAHALGMPAH